MSNTKSVVVDERQSMRTEVSFPAHIVAAPGLVHAALVHNISAHGVMVELGVKFAPGRPVTVELPGLGGVAGRVAWVRDGHAGIAFATPLSLAEFRAIA
jgi:PilZ domain